MDGITANTEEQTVERVEEVVTHHTLDAVGESVHCDGKYVWVCESDERVDIAQFRAALDAIEAGAKLVDFGDGVGYIERDSGTENNTRIPLVLYIGGERRSSNINCDIHDDLRDLLDAACE